MVKTEDVEIAVEVIRETEKALLISDGKTEVWLPKSLISKCCKENNIIIGVTIPEWLALDKGLI